MKLLLALVLSSSISHAIERPYNVVPSRAIPKQYYNDQYYQDIQKLRLGVLSQQEQVELYLKRVPTWGNVSRDKK